MAFIRTTQDVTATLAKCNMASSGHRAAAFTDGIVRILRRLQGAVCFGVGLSIMLYCSLATAQQPTQVPSKAQSDMSKDGRHDFDFEVGNWNAHVKTLVHRPFSFSGLGRVFWCCDNAYVTQTGRLERKRNAN